MSEKSYSNFIIPAVVLYLAVPLIYMLVGDFPDRTVLKEFLSLLTVGAFFLMLGQFYLSRVTKPFVKGHKMSRIVKLHKAIGYIFIPVLFLHPFFVVLPRYFESGVEPMDAFLTMLTTFGTTGIVLGIISTILMILLGITSLLRKKMKMKYTTWRVSHGILSMMFIILATWHAVDLGRHMDILLSVYTILMSAAGVIFLGWTYLYNPKKKGENNG